MEKNMLSKAQIIDTIDRVKAHNVKIAVADIDGILRGKYLQRDKFASVMEHGFGFCSVIFGWDCSDKCYDNSKISGWHNGYPDAKAYIDTNTFRCVPWDNLVPFFLADFADPKGGSLPVCPRSLLKTVIERAENEGYKSYFGVEFEWFNFLETPKSLQDKNYMNPQPITPGMFGYSVLRQSNNQPFLSAILNELKTFNIPLEGLHSETGPGVLEAAIEYSDALEAADRAVLFKSAVKEIGTRFGIMPSFMARWSEQYPGCGGHMHQSLWDKQHKNIFHDAKSPNGMSKKFTHYIAGQLALLPELLAMYAPTVNSYKRLVEGYWAPTRATWGIDNRTTALRVILGGAKSMRVETRVAGSDMNPYLAIAAALASGLYGIEQKLELSDPIVGNGYEAKKHKRFSTNLYDAAMLMGESKIVRRLFGDAFVDHFVNSRLWECRQHERVVTSYERERYFEII